MTSARHGDEHGEATADEWIEKLALEPHPEGGHYRETFRDAAGVNGRGHSTAIYYLLKRGERSHWHRVDATEIWHHYAGASLELRIAAPGGAVERLHVGSGAFDGERPQAIVPVGYWQSATSLGSYSLVGCTVSPAFEFSGFELAPADFEP